MPLRQPEWREGPTGKMHYYELGFKRLGWVDPRWPGGVGAHAIGADNGVVEFPTIEEAKRYVEVTHALAAV